MGSKMDIKDYMSKVRRHYKGEEVFAEFEETEEVMEDEPASESAQPAQPTKSTFKNKEGGAEPQKRV